MAYEQLLETGNFGLWNHEQTPSVSDEVVVRENDGCTLVPIEEDLGFRAIQAKLDCDIDRAIG